ncbi:UNVERIFIED_CONTAM: hypothetical protein FKN15_063053 [Acipenser sinensis]
MPHLPICVPGVVMETGKRWESVICLLIACPAPTVSGENQAGPGQGSPSSPILAQETDAAPEWPAVETADVPQPAQSSTGDLVASRPIEPAALGLVPERLYLSHLGLSNRVTDTLQNARAVITRSQYGYKWGVFQMWCLPSTP